MHIAFFLDVLQHLFQWSRVLVDVLGAVIAAGYFRRTRWAGVVAAGFVLDVLGQVAFQLVMPYVATKHTSEFSSAALALSVYSVIAYALLVVGVVGVLATLGPAKSSPES